jgi:hypothetical protein
MRKCPGFIDGQKFKMVSDMIIMTFPCNIHLVKYFVEKMTLLLDKCGITETMELSEAQHELLVNAIMHGSKNQKEEAIKFCIDFAEDNTVKLSTGYETEFLTENKEYEHSCEFNETIPEPLTTINDM